MIKYCFQFDPPTDSLVLSIFRSHWTQAVSFGAVSSGNQFRKACRSSVWWYGPGSRLFYLHFFLNILKIGGGDSFHEGHILFV